MTTKLMMFSVAGILFLAQLEPARGESRASRKATGRLLATLEELRSAEPDEGPQGSGAISSATGEEQPSGIQQATFGTGCFWCTEAVFQGLRGVKRVVSGYSGGQVPNPTYEQVLTGLTGHAEVVQLEFDPAVISYKKLLEVFWLTHDPTTLNRQGPDIGTQYRSVIFYHNDQQRELAQRHKAKINQERVFPNPVVTQVTEFSVFFPAKGYHQDYFARNGRAPYCRNVIRPKVKRFNRLFQSDLKRAK